MVLAYYQQLVEEDALVHLFNGDVLGVPMSRIERLTSWGYVVDYRSVDFEQISHWIDQGVPPIAAVRTEFLDHWDAKTQHAVVITGIDENKVHINDPALDEGPTVVSMNGFLAAWLEMDETAAAITLT